AREYSRFHRFDDRVAAFALHARNMKPICARVAVLQPEYSARRNREVAGEREAITFNFQQLRRRSRFSVQLFRAELEASAVNHLQGVLSAAGLRERDAAIESEFQIAVAAHSRFGILSEVQIIGSA